MVPKVVKKRKVYRETDLCLTKAESKRVSNFLKKNGVYISGGWGGRGMKKK
jgi:hypothetical protein